MSLKAELTVTKEQLARESFPVFSNNSETEQQPEGSTNAALPNNAEWSSVVKKTKTKPSIPSKSASYPESAKLVSPEERKFNIIIYGIKECKKGKVTWGNFGNGVTSGILSSDDYNSSLLPAIQ